MSATDPKPKERENAPDSTFRVLRNRLTGYTYPNPEHSEFSRSDSGSSVTLIDWTQGYDVQRRRTDGTVVYRIQTSQGDNYTRIEVSADGIVRTVTNSEREQKEYTTTTEPEDDETLADEASNAIRVLDRIDQSQLSLLQRLGRFVTGR